MFDILKNGKGEVLSLLFRDPEKEYYLREISTLLGKKGPHYKPVLDYLVKEGVLIDEKRGPLRFFKLNKNYFLYDNIKDILSKTIGLEFNLKKMVNNVRGIICAFVFGSIAKKSESANSDIDLFLIGDEVDRDGLIRQVKIYEKILGREINYQIYGEQELRKKLLDKNGFLLNIFSEPIILLKGEIDEYRRTIK